MKKYLLFSLLCFVAFWQEINAQNIETKAKRGYKYNNNFDIAYGIGSSNEFSLATSWVHFHGIGKKKRLKIGYGIRLTHYNGLGKIYKTAPADLIREKKIDEIYFLSPQTNSINITYNFQYSISKKFEFGFNIDAIGLSFGAEKNATRAATTTTQASPTSANLLIVGNYDIGNLNSEFYVRYWLHERFAIRAGFSHLFSEYTTNKKLAYDNDRYRMISNLGFVAFTFSPFR
jgi:hypothetical protein